MENTDLNITSATDEIASTTSTTEPTGEPVTNQAPTPAIPDKLPDNYLADGYYATTDKGAKYLRPEFVGEYAETMAKLLVDMKPTDFNG